jgi:hypothetical protein
MKTAASDCAASSARPPSPCQTPAPAANAPAANAPTVGPQKICVVCGQNVAGRPRTKDNSGNYYCRSCYDEKARAREQLAASRVGAPALVGGGGGDGGGEEEVIDLAAMEPSEQFDESMQPPPPPIPDMDLVAPPIPDMQEPIMAEPVVVELPKPKKKKKKKKGAAAAKKVGADTILAKIVGLPFETWVIAVGVMMIVAALVNTKAAAGSIGGLWLLGIGCVIWGHICCAIVAFSEDTTSGVRYLIFPFYQLFFILTNWSNVQRYVLRIGIGIVFVIAGVGISVKVVKEGFEELSSRAARNAKVVSKDMSNDPGFKLIVDLEEPPGEEAEQEAQEKQISEAILASFKQRGVKPPQGEKYDVQATVTQGHSATDKITIPFGDKKIKVPAPMLTCQLVVKSPAGSEIYNDTRAIVMAKDAFTKASDQDQETEDFFDKQLWKDVVPRFKELADQVPLTPPGATTPAGTTPNGTATPATPSATPDSQPPAR